MKKLITLLAVAGFVLALAPASLAAITATGDVLPDTATWESGSVTGGTLGDTGVGTVTVSGYTGTDDLTLSGVTIGNQSGGDGTLNIQTGAKVRHPTTTFSVGALAGSKGTVNVTGTDGSGHASTWDLGSSNVEMYFGNAGEAVLNVTAGGYAYWKKTMVGNSAGSTATITVSGTGSKLRNNYTHYMGRSGTATLDILDGGWMDEGENSYIGNDASGVGTVTVSGIDGGGTASRFTAPYIYVGNNGTGTLNIDDGGVVRASTQLRIDNNGGGGGTIYMSNNGVLALKNDYSANLATFLGAIYVGGAQGNYVNQIKYGSPGNWTDLTTSTDLTGIGTLTYYSSSTLINGVEMNGYTVLVLPLGGGGPAATPGTLIYGK